MVDLPNSKHKPRSSFNHEGRAAYLLLVLLVIFFCGSTLFFFVPQTLGEDAANILPPVYSTGVANYQPVLNPTPLRPLSWAIIENILIDDAPLGADISARLTRLENFLLTPIPFATRQDGVSINLTATQNSKIPDRSINNQITPSPAGSATLSQSTPSFGTASPVPSLIATSTREATSRPTPTATRLAPSRTLQPVETSAPPKPTATKIKTSTQTAEPLPTASLPPVVEPSPTSTVESSPTPTETVIPSPTPADTWVPSSTPTALALSPTPSDTLTPSPTPIPTLALHVGNYVAFSTNDGNFWSASIVIWVHNSSEAPVAGVLVSGSWEQTFGNFNSSCTTNAGGYCIVINAKIPDNGNLTSTYNLSELQKTGYGYDPSANHDPGGCQTPACDSVTVHQ